jgi:hypothetical protein
VNAAFLLVTTAWLAGADPVPPPAHPAPAPVASSASCDGCCNDDCGCGGHKLFGKLKGLFHRDCGCDTGCNTGCDTCGHGHAWGGGWGHKSADCGCNDDCGCGGHKLFGKLKGLFHRGDCGCDTCGCDSCGANGAIAPAPAGAVAPRAEPIPAPKEAPKKMPNAPAKKVEALTPQPATPATNLIIEQ